MNAAARDTSRPSDVQALAERLTREHFPGSPIRARRTGGVAATFRKKSIASAFEPVERAADGALAGHHALLRVTSDDGADHTAGSLFAETADDTEAVQLDRLFRTVHALNYFPGGTGEGLLFLDIARCLLTAVRADHGAYFESILSALGVSPNRVAIVLPADALEDPVTFVRAAISYRIRGYRVLARLRFDTEADLAHVFLADPHYVAYDAPSARDPQQRSAQALARRGIDTLIFATGGARP